MTLEEGGVAAIKSLTPELVTLVKAIGPCPRCTSPIWMVQDIAGDLSVVHEFNLAEVDGAPV
jgi:hypothetical protein